MYGTSDDTSPSPPDTSSRSSKSLYSVVPPIAPLCAFNLLQLLVGKDITIRASDRGGRLGVINDKIASLMRSAGNALEPQIPRIHYGFAGQRENRRMCIQRFFYLADRSLIRGSASQ